MEPLVELPELAEPLQTRPPEPASPPPKRGVWGSVATVGALLLLKLKSALALLKFASLGKFAMTALSMVGMIWFEALRGGFLFGLGFVLLLLIHELGHGYAIRRAGLTSGWPVFIPMFGAMIALKEPPKSRAMEAEIAYGGPLWGTAASLVCAALYFATGARLFLSLAYTGFFLNLFNLVPVSPLDGGRVAQVFSRRAWIVGGILLGGMFFATMAPQLLLIGVMAATHAFRRQQADDASQAQEPPEVQATWTFRYFALCFFLGASMYLSQRMLH
jgi:Zn-dependent protease